MSENKYYIYINGSKVAVSKELYDYDRQSERKITYAEIDRKTERFKVDRENLKAEFIPSLEDSLDRLSEIGEQFAEKDSDFSSHADMRIDLRRALERLSHNERELIYKLFFYAKPKEKLPMNMAFLATLFTKRSVLS